MAKELYLFRRRSDRSDYSGVWTLPELNFLRETDELFTVSELKETSFFLNDPLTLVMVDKRDLNLPMFHILGTIDTYSVVLDEPSPEFKFSVNDTTTYSPKFTEMTDIKNTAVVYESSDVSYMSTEPASLYSNQITVVNRFDTRSNTFNFLVKNRTAILLHFNGVDGTAPNSDQNGNPYSQVYSALLSTTQKRFGTSSLKGFLSGSISTPISSIGGYIPEKFTVESWVWVNAFSDDESAAGSLGIFACCDWGSYNGIGLYISKTKLVLNNSGTIIAQPQHGITPGSWNHFAWSKDGNTHRLFVNGGMVASVESTSIIPSRPTIYIGSITSHAWMNGYMDEVRVSLDCLYTGNFTVPSSEFTF